VRLTKLELQGFKSFADHTALRFEAGVTAVVGPNGCGKSNVSDAIRWVLGEQRARMLRGGSMTEVIFQGSSARRPVNVAEVSLHFDNSEGTLPVPFREVVITRRLSRSGESEYFLNRAPCRLRDVQDLVRGTGLGADSGVVIESRMIDALLSDRPDERRELFEEAAGVGLYRDRRRSTERRLEETAGDLGRLDDLVNEVTTQVRALARQRKRAERHAELTGRRFALEVTLAAREMASWKGELAALDARLAELQLLNPQMEAREAGAARAREEASRARAEAEALRHELTRIVAAGRQGVLALRGEIAVAEERQRNALSRRERAERERDEGQELGTRTAEERARAAAEHAEARRALGDAAEQLAEHAAAEEEARRAVAAARQRAELLERQARELRDQARRLEIDRDGAARERQDVAQRRAALEGELSGVRERVALARRDADHARDGVAEAREGLAVAQGALEEARAGVRRAREHEASARAEVARADEARTALQGRVNALEALERDRVGLAPAASRLLKERAQFGDGAVLGPLTDFLTADQDAAALVERYLGAGLHAVVVRDRAAAERVRAWHAAANPGPLLLLPADALADAAAPGGLAGRVRADGPAARWAAALLGGVEVLGDGAAFVDARGGVLLPGHAGGPGPLRRRAELDALRAQLDTADDRRDAARRAADAARRAAQAAEHEQAEAAEALAVAQQASRHADDVAAEADRRRQRAEREAADAEALGARLAARADELDARTRELGARAAQAADGAGGREREAAAARETLGGGEEALEAAREARTVWQVEQAQAQARLQVAADRERRLEREAATAAERLAQLTRELSSLAEADGELTARFARWHLELESREGELADAEARLADAEEAARVADAALVDAGAALDAARRENARLAEETHAAALRHTQLAGRRDALRGRLEAEWRRPLDELLDGHEPLDGAPEALGAELVEVRAALEQLGVVNPLAVEEHEEEVRRLEFLAGQRADLAQARGMLQQAIREIDATARELFLATFAQARDNFRQIFQTLFGGGECDLRLEDPARPLDCDIEVHASPRGKKTQRIHLLSSGERALVALSLLFGIFLTKPSPFCLLDEVDAPLDDQNVGRFVRMLNQFKARTQFIVITHNPRTTTEAADAVYGVTMQEPGVSSVVSVRLRGGPAVDDARGAAAPAEDDAALALAGD
jgi:chromosome segregation protein